MDRLNLLYRGPLSSCNYDCTYCPFAKRRESSEQLTVDRDCLERFLSWIEPRDHRPHGVFFTPWGEALVRHWYRTAIVRLSHLSQIVRVAVQTNLSCRLDWLKEAEKSSIALWTTFHPSEISLDAFVEKCWQLSEMEIPYSVGAVGIPEHADLIDQLRSKIPKNTYLWVNAFKSSGVELPEELLKRFERIDPQFPINNQYHQSYGKNCATGLTTVSIDGDGDVRRCHFVQEVLGNVYRDVLDNLLAPRTCPNQTCGCHIGYVHLKPLKLDRVYRENVLERIPARD